jgi:hypothetical protein
MTIETLTADTVTWLDALPAEFLFLLCLPFLVAAAGMAVHREPADSAASSFLNRCGIPAGLAAAVALVAEVAS